MVIRVLAKRPDSDWYTTNISNTLANMQRFVGGYIEAVGIFANACIICNEEGRLRDLPYNYTIAGMDFFGDIFLCGTVDGEFVSIETPLKDWKEAIA